MVAMTGDTVGVEGEKAVSPDLTNEVEHVGGQVVHIDPSECAVGVAQKSHRVDAQHPGGAGQLACTKASEVAIDAVQRGGLSVGEAEHRHRCPGIGEAGKDRAEAEGLVVGVGHYDHDRTPRRQVVTRTEVAPGPVHATPDWTGMPASRHSSMPSRSRRAERPCRDSNRTAS